MLTATWAEHRPVGGVREMQLPLGCRAQWLRDTRGWWRVRRGGAWGFTTPALTEPMWIFFQTLPWAVSFSSLVF